MTENKVTPDQIKKLLDEAETQEHIFWGKTLVVSYRLKNGFTIQGTGSCVDPTNFNLEIGRGVARIDVENQMWRLEGYRLQEELFKAGVI